MIAASLLATFVGAGCSDGVATWTSGGSASIGSASAETGTGSTTANASSESSTAPTSSADTTSSESGESSESGSTGEPTLPGRSSSQLVGAGQRMQSSTHSMIFTLGQPSQHQSTHVSSGHRLQGGLVGANGSPP